MRTTHRLCFAFALAGMLELESGCGRKVEPSASQPAPADQSPAAPSEPASSLAQPAVAPAETARETQSAIAAAQAAVRSQNYSNAVQQFDSLKASGKLTGDQLTQVQDAEARMMRELAAKAATGDPNAVRQFRELADRPRGGR